MRLLSPRSPHIPATFGSASFMSRLDVIQLKLNQRGENEKLCPYVGGIADPYGRAETLESIYARTASAIQSFRENGLRDGSGHLLTVAPTRSGKGTTQIIPNLLSWDGSCLIVDIKGENYLKSAGCREKAGHKIYRFAPFEKESEIWNPLLSIRANPEAPVGTPEEEEDTRYLVNLLVAPSGSNNDVFWENSAKNFLEGLILHVRTAPLSDILSNSMEPEVECQVQERSMREVRRLLSLNKESFALLLDDMSFSFRPLVKQAANTMARLSAGNGKTGQSILAVALEQTAVWTYERLQGVTYRERGDGNREPAENDFSFTEMRNGKTTIYLIIPPDYLTEYRSVLRVLIGVAMRELRQTYAEVRRTPELREKPPIMFFLDEFPQLAYMRPIEDALLYLAGYGIRFWFFVQDISQLQKHYPDSWRTFFANTGTQCFYGVSDIETAKVVSEMIGTATVGNESYNSGISSSETWGDNWGSSSSSTSNSGVNGGSSSTSGSSEGSSYSYQAGKSAGMTMSFVGRSLMTPSEVMQMHDREQIIFMKGLKPVRCNTIPYYENKEFRKKSEIKPAKDVDFE